MEILTLSRTINAFFRWEFNSCESLVTGQRGQADRLRQRLPGHRDHLAALLLPVGDHATVSLVGVLRRHRPASRGWTPPLGPGSTSPTTRTCPGRTSWAATRRLADEYFQAEEYREFCSTSLASLPGMVYDWIASPGVRRAAGRRPSGRPIPQHEQERFLAHFRGLLGLWVADQA